jgi:hypothetical protein
MRSIWRLRSKSTIRSWSICSSVFPLSLPPIRYVNMISSGKDSSFES